MLTASQIANNWSIFGIGVGFGIILTILVIGIIQIVIHEREMKKLSKIERTLSRWDSPGIPESRD